MDQAPSLLRVDLSAIISNYKYLQQKAGNAAVGASVKANAYGLGASAVARALSAAGCRDFFVATPAEGIALRAATPYNIYVFSGIHTAAPDIYDEHGLRPVLNSLADIERWTGGPCAVFFDTGMNRLGLSREETAHVIAHPELMLKNDVRLCLSHFACAEDAAHPLNTLQTDRFDTIRHALVPHMPHAQWSLCNSSGIFNFPQAHHDLVRPGYALYGGNPTPADSNPMRPVVTLHSRVLQTREVRAGDTIGYSATHRFDTDTQTATIFLGYADGFMRTLGGRGDVFWHGQPCPVLGRISMDLATIGIGHLTGVKPKAGDMVEVLGHHQDIETLASAAGTIGYDILTSLGARHERLYIGEP